MLKSDLHIHLNCDPKDSFIKYDVYQLIAEAKKRDYNVLGITCHNYIFNDKAAITFAKKQGILILPGIEKDINEKHVLVFNPPKEIVNITTLEELKELKKRHKNMLIIAPHPFYPDKMCLGKKTIEHLDLFDAWEYSFFHTNWMNPNKKMQKLAAKYNKPIVGNSDLHDMDFFGTTFSLIDAKQNQKSIFEAIKAGKTQVLTRPIKTRTALKIVTSFSYVRLKRKVQKAKKLMPIRKIHSLNLFNRFN